MKKEISKYKILLYIIAKTFKWILSIFFGLFIFFCKLLIEISKDY